MSERYEVHDLVWLRADVPQRYPEWFAALPPWARTRLQQDQPLVVRREAVAAGKLALGLRGQIRAERQACEMFVQEIVRKLRPSDLQGIAPRTGRETLPALKTWESLRSTLALPFLWGPGGSTGYELATGTDAVSATSDLDLVLQAPLPVTRAEALGILAQIDALASCHCDVQIALPAARAFALREWARGDARVLVKTPSGPVLTDAPWRVEETR